MNYYGFREVFIRKKQYSPPKKKMSVIRWLGLALSLLRVGISVISQYWRGSPSPSWKITPKVSKNGLIWPPQSINLNKMRRNSILNWSFWLMNLTMNCLFWKTRKEGLFSHVRLNSKFMVFGAELSPILVRFLWNN